MSWSYRRGKCITMTGTDFKKKSPLHKSLFFSCILDKSGCWIRSREPVVNCCWASPDNMMFLEPPFRISQNIPHFGDSVIFCTVIKKFGILFCFREGLNPFRNEFVSENLLGGLQINQPRKLYTSQLRRNGKIRHILFHQRH